jgi:nicotinamide mononucleotide transporter
LLPTLDSIAAQLAALWPWEAIAVALAIAYLVLAIRESLWCWPTGIASTLIYLALFFNSRLYAESVLQLFYIAISIYGWRQWAGNKNPVGGAQAPKKDRHLRASHSASPQQARQPAPIPITTWHPRQHAAALLAIAAFTGISGALLAAYTPAALPYLDSFTAWSSVVTTWMVARKVLENWLYWFVIDGLSVYIYMKRGLWLTSGLFVLYLVLIVVGYRAWRRHMGVAS